MTPHELATQLLDALVRHMPTGAAWIPFAVAGGFAAFGLIFLLRGARLAPYVVGLAAAAGGGVGGLRCAALLALPDWPVAAAGALLGLLLGLALFRLWLALQVAAMLVLIALGAYGTRLLEPLSTFTSQGLDTRAPDPLVTLAGPLATNPSEDTWQAQLAALWKHLVEQVPSFELNIAVVVAAAGLAGLVFAGLLPRLARSFWAATLGTLLTILGALTLVQVRQPALLQKGHTAWLIGALSIWAISAIWNALDLIGPCPKKAPPPADRAAS